MKNKLSVFGASAIGSYGLLKLPQSKVDPYTRAVIGGVAGGTIFLTGVIYESPLIKWIGIGVMVGSALTLEEVARIKGGKLVSNKFNQSVFVLHETEGVKELQPNEIPNYNIDGLTVKGLNGIFKVRDGVYAKVDSNGKISETIGIGKILNNLSDAGFKDKSWCESISSQSDSRWLNLYERSV